MTLVFGKRSGSVAAFELVPGRAGPFAHRFGGPPVAVNGNPGLHRLYTLDLTDQRLGIPPIPVRFLPLVYGFHYDAARLAYVVDSDREFRVVSQDVTRPAPGFPYENYPDAFPETPVEAVERDLAALLDREDPTHPFRKKVLPGGGRRLPTGLDAADTIALAASLPQGPSRTNCPRPACAGPLEILCVVDPEPVPGVALWDEVGRDEDVRIVFERCPACGLIRASNQCT